MPLISVGDIDVHYEQSGEGTDLVLVHGLGNTLALWDPNFSSLAAHHRVLRYDVRGFGQTSKPAGPYSPRMFADDLVGLLDRLGIDRAHILGLSMGGVITQRFGLDHADRVRSLILVSTSSEVGEKSVATWQRLADQIERRGFDPRVADASRAFAPAFVERHPEIVHAAGQANASNDPLSYAAAARAVSDYRWTSELAAIDKPVLILQGLDDRMTPPGGSVKMSRVLPRRRLLMVPGVGHNLPTEVPDVFHAAVLGFTGGVDAMER